MGTGGQSGWSVPCRGVRVSGMATRATGDRRWGRRLLALAVGTAVAGTAAVAFFAGRGQDDPNEPRERSPERALAALAGLEDVLLDPAVLDDPEGLSGRLQLNFEE